MRVCAILQTVANGKEHTAANGKAWRPPRGIKLFTLKNRPRRPFAVQWRSSGKRKTQTFSSASAQLEFAKDLAGAASEHGLAAYQMNPGEARDWRAFRARLGEGVTLDAVLKCWERNGVERPKLTVREAVGLFLAAKQAEGLTKATLAHYRPSFDRLMARMGNDDVQAVAREQIAEWVEALEGEDYTRRTQQKLAKTLFGWLKTNRRLDENPCDGLKPVKIVQEEVKILTLDEARALFYANESQPREVCGRLALEAFCGFRFSSAQLATGADIDFAARGIVLPAKNIKTRRRQYIDGLPENLWWWLEWSRPSEWSMTPRQYLEAKSRAVIRAGLEVQNRAKHNACRHSFATYHMAAGKDAAKTAAVLCHTNQRMLYQHYKGKATETEGERYFLIYPIGASCPIPRPS